MRTTCTIQVYHEGQWVPAPGADPGMTLPARSGIRRGTTMTMTSAGMSVGSR